MPNYLNGKRKIRSVHLEESSCISSIFWFSIEKSFIYCQLKRMTFFTFKFEQKKREKKLNDSHEKSFSSKLHSFPFIHYRFVLSGSLFSFSSHFPSNRGDRRSERKQLLINYSCRCMTFSKWAIVLGETSFSFFFLRLASDISLFVHRTVCKSFNAHEEWKRWGEREEWKCVEMLFCSWKSF